MFYPTGRYNLNFDFGAILLDAILLIFYLLRPRIIRERRTRTFLILLFTLSLSAMSEVCASICRNIMGEGIPIDLGILRISTFFSHFFHNSLPFTLCIYLYEVIGISHRTSRRTYILLIIPEVIMIVFLFIPPLRTLVYYFTNTGEYMHGIIYIQLYAAIHVFYLSLSLFTVISYRKALLPPEYISILVVVIGFGLSMIPMVINQYMKITIFLQSLLVMIICIILESDNDQFESSTGLRRRYALWKDVRQCFETRNKASVISVKISSLSYYRMILGTLTIRHLEKMIGTWLQQFASDKIRVYHTQEESYAILFYQIDEDEVRKIAGKIQLRFHEEWNCDEAPVFLTTQIWIGAIPDQITDEDQMNVFIDSPYDERLPENTLHFQNNMAPQQRMKDVEFSLQHAISNNSLEVFYQPIFDTRDSRIHSCEALVRMKDEKGGYFAPDEFIRVAEQTGMINRLGIMVFEKVVSFLAEEKPEQYGLDFVEVNLSPVQCMDPQLADQLTEILSLYHVPASKICLEITESAVIHNETAMRSAIEKLGAAGFSFALDDFGTGNANYSYVMKYPFQIIKIDKSFLWGAEKDENTRIILTNMLSLVKSLKRHAVVEGVESEQQRDFMISCGVDYLQGFYYSKPVPRDRFINFLMNFRV